jgi:hypothetical protein
MLKLFHRLKGKFFAPVFSKDNFVFHRLLLSLLKTGAPHSPIIRRYRKVAAPSLTKKKRKNLPFAYRQ